MAAPMTTLRLIAYSDYLCPWCFNVSVRLHRLEEEMDSSLEIEWRSFLLRPHARRGRSLDEFRAYTRSWLRLPSERGYVG
jgi:predicted DsbA family dithiol-disulfide isomerase